MKEPEHQTGGCSCGAVRFAVRAPTTWCAQVHHEGLGRLVGAAVVALTSVRVDRLTVEGHPVVFQRGPEPFTHHHFCGTCGTTVFLSTGGSEEICVATATLNGLTRPPSAALYADQARPWAPADPRLPAFGGPDGARPLGVADLRDRINRVAQGIRLATSWDRFELAELFRGLAAHAWDGVPDDLDGGLARTLERNDHWLLVAEEGGRLTGFCDLKRTSATAEGAEQLFLDDLFVADSARRKGVARRLVEAGLWLGRELGAVQITLHRNADDDVAAAFYAALGFEASDDVVMQRSLV